MKRTKQLSEQIIQHANKKAEGHKKEYDGDSQTLVSTGSTLLDLAISGGRSYGGGIPGGILIEIFGPSGGGKTVLLCEIAGAVRRQGGQVMFRDPEARLNQQFARLFGLNVDKIEYDMPSTVKEVFEPVREWSPKPAGKIHGVFADSLAALTTEWEENSKDQYGMRRAKEFSEQCRLTCRELTRKNLLMVCSNQIRQNIDAGPYGQRYKSPGGEAIGFYSSLRLRLSSGQKIKDKKRVAGKEITRISGIATEVEVFKSSVWKPHRTAPLYIMFDYGIDDIRANLKFIRTSRNTNMYMIGDNKLSNSIDEAIQIVEEDNLENTLKNETIALWEEIERKFEHQRKPKER